MLLFSLDGLLAANNGCVNTSTRTPHPTLQIQFLGFWSSKGSRLILTIPEISSVFTMLRSHHVKLKLCVVMQEVNKILNKNIAFAFMITKLCNSYSETRSN